MFVQREDWSTTVDSADAWGFIFVHACANWTNWNLLKPGEKTPTKNKYLLASAMLIAD